MQLAMETIDELRKLLGEKLNTICMRKGMKMERDIQEDSLNLGWDNCIYCGIIHHLRYTGRGAGLVQVKRMSSV